jgi:Leucine-rich repeat (LRR) protein
MDSKEYKISEIVDSIGVSKATVYNKLSSLKDILRNHVKVRKGVRYVDYEGFQIIKNSIGFSKEQYTDFTTPLTENLIPEVENIDNIDDSSKLESLEINDKYLESLEKQIEYLKSIITEKDKQLETRDLQINDMTKLVENSQVLLKQQQEKILFLESPPVKEKRSFWGMFKRG